MPAEIAGNIADVSNITSNIAENATDVLARAGKLSVLSQDLKESMDAFKM